MSFSILPQLPSVVTAGDAVSFYVNDVSFPATAWTSTVYFRNDAGTVLSFARSTTSGNQHVFVLTNTNTGTLTTGRNLVSFAFSDGTHRQVSDWQEITVLADPTATITPTFAQAQVTLLQTVIATFNATLHDQVSFNGQSFHRASIMDYQKQLSYWQSRVNFERNQNNVAAGIPSDITRIPIEFVA